MGEEAKAGRASELAVDKKTKNQLRKLSYIYIRRMASSDLNDHCFLYKDESKISPPSC